jgi:nucleoside 2-deoxyribosyltransferase
MGEAFQVWPTMGGWNEIDKLTAPTNDFSQAFVAMWFDPTMDEAYSVGIEPAVRANGYKALRIDNKEHVNKIDDEIIAEIRRSRFLIADFTCAPKDIRGGVYYEAGFAQGIGIPVIWTCSKHAENDLHFDTRQYAHIMWETPKELFEKLKNRIGAVLGNGPLQKN